MVTVVHSEIHTYASPHFPTHATLRDGWWDPSVSSTQGVYASKSLSSLQIYKHMNLPPFLTVEIILIQTIIINPQD
jgi:hypothetical protein